MSPIAPNYMEPMLPAEGNRLLEDLAFDLAAKANALAGQINPIVTASVGSLVRSMNCYYSNLIEGHNTHPHDINRALQKDYAADHGRRMLQLEAVAHITVQQAIDENKDDSSAPASRAYSLWLHREFCRLLPDELLWVEDPLSGRRVHVQPGKFREGGVIVGRHVPPDADKIPRFLDRFEQAYDATGLSKVRRVVSIAAAHHRFLWIHPFFDGNGRVARLMSHAMLKRLGVGSSLWAVSRGLARNAAQYKSLLMAADEPRRGDLNGRGSLSQEALILFCEFFLRVCLDQVEFMGFILRPTELLRRMEPYVEEEIRAERLPKGSFPLLREALLAGEFERGMAPSITGYKERMARNVLSGLLKTGLLVSPGPKSPVRLGFPLMAVDRWFPALYPTNVS